MLKTSVKTNLLGFRCDELKNFNWIFQYGACFPVCSKNINVITCPSKFYDTILERCQLAKRRISIASLYIGTGSLEKNFLETIGKNMNRDRSVRLYALIDYQRGTRGDINSKTLLQYLVDCNPKQSSVAMFHTSGLRGIYKALLPPRWNELIGLQHMKIYVADDTVLLTGANCSEDYFTNRQDRYIEIKDADLADFYFGLITTVQEFSVQCRENSIEIMPNLEDRETFVKNANEKVKDYLDSWFKLQTNKAETNGVDTWIFPLVQMGEFGIQQDSTVTEKLLSTAPAESTLRLATGYFNLTDKYAETIVNQSKAKYSLLMAHPNANGFLGAKGAAGGIPYAYSLIARKFYEYVQKAKQTDRIQLFEYQRPGWTFHAKGLWYYPPMSQVPWGTVIGSPNLGERSLRRDLETQIALFTTSPELQASLHDECSRLHEHARECSAELLGRRVPLWVHLAVRGFRNFF